MKPFAVVIAIAFVLSSAARADDAPPGMAAAPAPDPRKTWLVEGVAKIKATPEAAARTAAIRDFLAKDEKGDCVEALCALALESKKDKSPALRLAIVRALGRPGLDAAVPTLLALIEDKDDEVRSNVYVSLEYVGSITCVDALTKRLPKEKDEARYNNVCRALGRCGAKRDAVRKTLIHEMNTAKSDRVIAGPVIGITYFEGDADAARAVEKAAQKEGERVKRAFLLWALTEIRDQKSADFVLKEIIPKETVPLALAFDNAIYSILAGSDNGTAQTVVAQGMGLVIQQAGGISDSARVGREGAGFTPKGEFGAGR